MNRHTLPALALSAIACLTATPGSAVHSVRPIPTIAAFGHESVPIAVTAPPPSAAYLTDAELDGFGKQLLDTFRTGQIGRVEAFLIAVGTSPSAIERARPRLAQVLAVITENPYQFERVIQDTRLGTRQRKIVALYGVAGHQIYFTTSFRQDPGGWTPCHFSYTEDLGRSLNVPFCPLDRP